MVADCLENPTGEARRFSLNCRKCESPGGQVQDRSWALLSWDFQPPLCASANFFSYFVSIWRPSGIPKSHLCNSWSLEEWGIWTCRTANSQLKLSCPWFHLKGKKKLCCISSPDLEMELLLSRQPIWRVRRISLSLLFSRLSPLSPSAAPGAPDPSPAPFSSLDLVQPLNFSLVIKGWDSQDWRCVISAQPRGMLTALVMLPHHCWYRPGAFCLLAHLGTPGFNLSISILRISQWAFFSHSGP